MELTGAGKKTAAESRRLVKSGRELLALKPTFRRGQADERVLAEALNELEAAVSKTDGRLIMGLLGGTGVGKSTLISALAGAPVSASSVIRPATDRPVIYRHESFPAEALPQGREVPHQVEALKHLAIIDFPDFDSFKSEHRQATLDCLSGLDLLVWIADHHKYADRRLYQLMAQANSRVWSGAQAALLNKIDDLTARPDGEEALAYVLDSFARMLENYAGWRGSPPWPVSALAALEAPDDPKAGGLAPLRAMIGALRESKMRQMTTAGNLAARNADFLNKLKAAAAPEAWLERLTELKNINESFAPRAAMAADLAAIGLMRPAYVRPYYEETKKEARGLTALWTDLWDFTVARFKSASPPPLSSPAPRAPGFARYLLWRRADFENLADGPRHVGADELLRQSEDIFREALARRLTPRRAPGAWPLRLWPVIWLLLLLWAEAGGQYTLSNVTAALLRSAAPWLIFSLVGEVAISRFIWFRVRRGYENDFQAALREAEEKLLHMADEYFTRPLGLAVGEATAALNLLADLTAQSPEDQTKPTDADRIK